MVNLVTFYSNKVRFIIMNCSSELKSSKIVMYIFNDNFYFIASLNKDSVYCNSYSNDISRRISVLNINHYEIFKKEQQTYLLSKVNNLFFS